MNNIRKATMGNPNKDTNVTQTTKVEFIMPGLYVREDQKHKISLIIDVPLVMNNMYLGSFNTRIHDYENEKEWSWGWVSDGEQSCTFTACSEDDDCILIYYEELCIRYITVKLGNINRTYYFHHVEVVYDGEITKTIAKYYMYSFNNTSTDHYIMRHKSMEYVKWYYSFNIPILVDAKDDTDQVTAEQNERKVKEYALVNANYFPYAILNHVDTLFEDGSPRYKSTESET